MSSHSRSSSEVESIKFNEALQVCSDIFEKDLDIVDIDSRLKEILTIPEYQSIKDEEGEEEKIIRLMKVLCCKDDETICRFLNMISYDYDWLVEAVKNEHKEPKKETERYLTKCKMLRYYNQTYINYNVLRMDPFMKLRLCLINTKRFEKVILHGELGTGKKWLANDVLCEHSVMKAMNFQIFWIDVSQCCSMEEDLRMLKYFRKLLDDDTTSSRSPVPAASQCATSSSSIESNQILEQQQILRTKLQNNFKKCLLVLSNVQNVKTCDAFNLGCKMLIITRNQKVTEYHPINKSNNNTHITMNARLTPTECYSLFEKYLSTDRYEWESSAMHIYELCEGHPYLLSIIAQNLRQKPKDWKKWINNLSDQYKGLDKQGTMTKKISTAIEISLRVLTKEMLERYATFAIFPPSIFIPVNLLRTLWNISDWDTESTLDKFYKHSLIKRDEQEGEKVCIPFIYRSHLSSCESILSMINPLELHRKVIAYYEVDEKIKLRTEINLFSDDLYDLYFYQCIGYHLQKARRTDIFAKIYLDFGFLEQTIRAVGILTTIGNLKFYEEEICAYDSRRRELLRDICNYLVVVEDKLTNSDDTCLLQYALMSSGNINDEALRQAKNFPNRVWFTENGNFHQRRQLFKLLGAPEIVIILDEEIYLTVLDNKNMIIANVSLDCTTCPVILVNDDEMDATIEKAELFRDKQFILTLDNRGVLKVWDISDDFRRSLVHRRSSKQKVDPVNFKKVGNIKKKRFKQLIHKTTMEKHDKIVAFHIEQTSPKHYNETRLHAVFVTGDICVYLWNKESEEFEPFKIPILHTHFKEARFFSKFLSKYYMILNAKGDIKFWNTRDQSEISFFHDWPETTHQHPLIYYEMHTINLPDYTECTYIIFVFSNKIIRLSFQQKDCKILESEYKELYECAEKQHIICAKLTCDGDYLALGTNHGLVIFNTRSQTEILRSHVSDAITCVDIYKSNDRVYKYMIICGSKGKKLLNIFALQCIDDGENDRSLVWAHKTFRTNNETNTDSELEPNVWLRGDKLYDVSYDDDGGGIYLVAADSKNRIHQVSMTNTRNWSLISPTETSSAITAITSNKYNAFVGYENGAIWNINNEKLERNFTENSICYLQLMDESILIASSENKVLLLNIANNDEKTYSTLCLKQCFKVFDHYLLLIQTDGTMVILDINKQFDKICDKNDVMERHENFYLCGWDFKNSNLFLATSTYNIHVYKFTYQNNDNKIEIPNSTVFPLNEMNNTKITCLTASNDATLVAIGLESGDIKLYKFDDNRKCCLLFPLQSHKHKIYDMKFSANADVLVSCSEQLCFWNVSYMLNNPFQTNSPKRRSSRFTSQHSSDIEEVDKNIQNSRDVNHLHVNNLQNAMEKVHVNGDAHTWQYKRGAAAKPELYACIKFDGNKAKKLFANPQFTQFNIIDDEGVHYHLELLNLDKEQQHHHHQMLQQEQHQQEIPYYSQSYSQIENIKAEDIDVAP